MRSVCVRVCVVLSQGSREEIGNGCSVNPPSERDAMQVDVNVAQVSARKGGGRDLARRE